MYMSVCTQTHIYLCLCAYIYFVNSVPPVCTQAPPLSLPLSPLQMLSSRHLYSDTCIRWNHCVEARTLLGLRGSPSLEFPPHPAQALTTHPMPCYHLLRLPSLPCLGSGPCLSHHNSPALCHSHLPHSDLLRSSTTPFQMRRGERTRARQKVETQIFFESENGVDRHGSKTCVFLFNVDFLTK